MKFLTITYPDINNGLGLRATLWLAGCSHHCKGCQNPQTWNYESGKRFDKRHKEKLYEILSKSYIDGLTLSGGDPLYKDNLKDLSELIHHIKEDFPNKTIWIFTGYSWGEVQGDLSLADVVNQCDVLVDGEYKEDLRDVTLAFRGSSNQRVIDIQKSLQEKDIVLYTE